MLSGEAIKTNFIVFGLTRWGLEPTIYHTRGEHTNHYTTNASFGKDSVQSHGTRIGNEFLASYPDWSDRFRNFCGM
jgi:hypothetical protein